MFRLSKKLKGLKPDLRKLSKDYLGDLSKRTKASYEKLCEVQMKTMTNPNSQGVVEEAHAYAKWKHLADLEEIYLRQKSKLHWLKVGDGNNRYFHQGAKNLETQKLDKGNFKQRWDNLRYA